MNWYYAVGQQQQGPVTEQQLQALAKDGVITGDTLVWREGLTSWQPWRTVGGPAMPPVPAAATAAATPTSSGQSIRPAATEFEYAGFWIRFVAKFIDGLVLGIPMLAIVAVAIVGMGGFAAITQKGQEMAFLLPVAHLVLQLVLTAMTILYNTVLVGAWGTTLGKKACGLKVIKADGSKPSYGRACGRAFAEIVSGLVCYIGYIIAGFDEQKRALHDHMCDTRVVKAR